MFKNTAGQKWTVFAFQDEGGTNPGEPVTGDAANITANLRIDGGAANAVDDLNPTELEGGYYQFDITQAECNGGLLVIAPSSATANVNVIGAPATIYTRTDVSGVEAKIDTLDTVADGIKAVTDNLPNSGALTDLATAAALAVVDGNVDSVLVDTGTTIPAQITALNNISAADVNAQVVDVLRTDTITEMTQGAPPASPTTVQMINYLYREWVRNKVVVDTNTANQKQVFADDGTTILYEKGLTDASSVLTMGEALTGA